MKALEKWTEGKSFLIALAATQTAASTRDLHEALKNVKNRRLYDWQFSLPHLPSWFALYRSHRRVIMKFGEFMMEFSNFGKVLVLFGKALNEGLEAFKRNPDMKVTLSEQEIEKGFAAQRKVLELSFKDIEDDFSENPYDPETKAKFENLFKDHEIEISFFYLVQSPCWILYQTSPTLLYRKARTGNTKALEKLLYLDPLLLHDPSVGRQLQALRFKNRTNDYERILDAVQKPLKAKVSKSKLKMSMAGLISSLAGGLNQPLTEHQIRALFDAVAQDAEGEDIDNSLPEFPQTFAKSIQNNPKGSNLQISNLNAIGLTLRDSLQVLIQFRWRSGEKTGEHLSQQRIRNIMIPFRGIWPRISS